MLNVSAGEKQNNGLSLSDSAWATILDKEMMRTQQRIFLMEK